MKTSKQIKKEIDLLQAKYPRRVSADEGKKFKQYKLDGKRVTFLTKCIAIIETGARQEI